MVFAIEIVIGM